MTLSWRRGLFRLWVVVSAAWTIILGFLLAAEINQFKTAQSAALKLVDAANSVDLSKCDAEMNGRALWRRYSRALAVDSTKENIAYVMACVIHYKNVGLSPQEIESYAVDGGWELDDLKKDWMQKTSPYFAWADLGSLALFWVVPIVSCLIIGIGGLWVASGFSPK